MFENMKLLFISSLVAFGIFAYPAFSTKADETPVEKLGFSVTADKTEYIVGDTMTLEFKLANESEKSVSVKELAIAIDSIEATFRKSSRKHIVQRIPVEDLKNIDLPKGESRTFTWKIPLFFNGSLSLDVSYLGHASRPTAKLDKVLIKDKTFEEGKESSQKMVAVFDTTSGQMIFELDEQNVLATSLNFACLVDSGYYDNLEFFRVVKDGFIQSGCPKNDGSGTPGYTIRMESSQKEYGRGSLVMARWPSHEDSAGSQFIVAQKALELDSKDYKYCSFGTLARGEDVLDKIAELEAERNRFGKMEKPKNPAKIEKARLCHWNSKTKELLETK